MKSISLLIVTLIFLPTVAQSATYKWVDSSGQVHYTDKPQPKSKKAVSFEHKTEITPRESAKAKARLSALQKQQKESARVNEINNRVLKRKRANARRKHAVVKKNCGRAKRNIKTLGSKSWAPIRRPGPPVNQGGSVVTVKQRPAEIKKNQDYLDRNC